MKVKREVPCIPSVRGHPAPRLHLSLSYTKVQDALTLNPENVSVYICRGKKERERKRNEYIYKKKLAPQEEF